MRSVAARFPARDAPRAKFSQNAPKFSPQKPFSRDRTAFGKCGTGKRSEGLQEERAGAQSQSGGSSHMVASQRAVSPVRLALSGHGRSRPAGPNLRRRTSGRAPTRGRLRRRSEVVGPASAVSHADWEGKRKRPPERRVHGGRQKTRAPPGDGRATSESVDAWPLAIVHHRRNRGHASAGSRPSRDVTGEG